MNQAATITAIPALPNQGGKTNVPGLRRLYLIEVRHVLALLDPRRQAGGLTTDWLLPAGSLQLSEDALIQRFSFPAERGEFEQKASVSVQGVTYAQVINLALPKDHPTTALIIQRMTGRKWIAVYDDANGLRKVVGTPKQPLRFLAQLKTNPNAYSCTWVTETRQPAWFLTDDDLFSLDADFSYGFSYEFFS